MQITRVMVVKIIFNSMRIACADLRAVAYDHEVALTMDSPRKHTSGSAELDLIPLRCHYDKSLQSDNSRRHRGISLVDPSLVHMSSHWTSAKSWNLRKSEVEISRKTHHYQEVQAQANMLVYGLAMSVKSLCC